MVRVLFVCLGNICRSPMAEYVFKDLVKKNGLEDKFYIKSAATSYEEEGNGMHYGTRRKLEEQKIEFGIHIARRLEKIDYEKYDLILGMEERNIKNINKIIEKDEEEKVYRLLDFSENPRDIADPWYTGNFDKTYEDIKEGCEYLLKYIKENFTI